MVLMCDDTRTVATASSTFTVPRDGPMKLYHNPTAEWLLPTPPEPMPRRQGGKTRRRHSVDFKPPEQTQVQPIEPLNDEVRAICWYSREEYDIIKVRNSLIVKMMKTGTFRESKDHSFRGLEHKLKEGFRQRRVNKFNALNAVLEEQDRQIAAGVHEPERIAHKYRRVSLNAAETAFVMGTRDAEESLSYLKGVAYTPSSSLEAHHRYHDHHNHHQVPSFQHPHDHHLHHHYYPEPVPHPHQEEYGYETHAPSVYSHYHFYEPHHSAPVHAVVTTAPTEDECSVMTASHSICGGPESMDSTLPVAHTVVVVLPEEEEEEEVSSSMLHYTQVHHPAAPLPQQTHQEKEQVRGLFTAASYIKRTKGHCRRSSM